MMECILHDNLAYFQEYTWHEYNHKTIWEDVIKYRAVKIWWHLLRDPKRAEFRALLPTIHVIMAVLRKVHEKTRTKSPELMVLVFETLSYQPQLLRSFMPTPTSYLSYFLTKGRYFDVLPYGGTDEKSTQFLSITGFHSDMEHLLLVPRCSINQIVVRSDFAYYDNVGPFIDHDVLDSMKKAIKYQSIPWCHRFIVNTAFPQEAQDSLFKLAWQQCDQHILRLFQKLSFPREVPPDIRGIAKNFREISCIVLNW